MINEILNTQAEQKYVKTTEQVERTFAYNFLLPDFVIFVVGITGAFGGLLIVFS